MATCAPWSSPNVTANGCCCRTPLPQVQHLATDLTTPKFAALFAAFPNATVHPRQPTATWVSPFALPR